MLAIFKLLITTKSHQNFDSPSIAVSGIVTLKSRSEIKMSSAILDIPKVSVTSFSFFWNLRPTENKRPAQLWPGYFLTRPVAISYFFWHKRKKWKFSIPKPKMADPAWREQQKLTQSGSKNFDSDPSLQSTLCQKFLTWTHHYNWDFFHLTRQRFSKYSATFLLR